MALRRRRFIGENVVADTGDRVVDRVVPRRTGLSIDKAREEPCLDQLRRQLTGLGRELLNEFWQQYRPTKKWPLARIVHSRHGKNVVRNCLRELGGGIVMEWQESSSRRIYGLTAIGVLLTDEGSKNFDLLVQYLEFLRGQYKDAPERLEFSHKDFCEAIGLPEEQVMMLGELVRLTNLSRGGGYGDNSWNVQVPDEIEDLPDEGPLSKSLEELLFRHYDAARPVFPEDQQRQTPAPSVSGRSRVDTEIVSPETGIVVDILKRRYQVFVSSTYEDLIEERQHVIQALLETRCIPVGMELFPAASVEQWELIKHVIDECDYYFVIMAGRYGSVHESGIGYTEMEFDYAVSAGKPVIGFFHKNPSSLPGTKLEQSDKGRERLKAFTEKVRRRLCHSWSSAADLGSAVKSAIVNEWVTNPQPGWIRANEVQNSPLVQRLKQRIANLEEERRRLGLPEVGY
jgi:hypothetical protein